jgi:hypothetical protein
MASCRSLNLRLMVHSLLAANQMANEPFSTMHRRIRRVEGATAKRWQNWTAKHAATLHGRALSNSLFRTK